MYCIFERFPLHYGSIYFICRCKLPGYDNDTYTVSSVQHNKTIQRYIPQDEERDGELSSCLIYTGHYLNQTTECTEYVYSDEMYGGVTLNMHVSGDKSHRIRKLDFAINQWPSVL